MKINYRDIIYGESLKAKLTILIIAAIILLIRRTDSFLNPQFWAEDGTIFFLQQYKIGPSAIFLPYAGYIHLIPRLIALFSDMLFSYSIIPAAYNISSFIITLFVIAGIFSPRLNVKYKGLFALSLVLIPHYKSEVFMNITNLQWLLCVLLIILLIKEDPNPKYGNIKIQYTTDFLTLFFCGLTGPFIIFMFPLFIWKWYHNRNKSNNIIILVIGIIVIIQLAVIFFNFPASKNSDIGLDINTYIQIFGVKVFGYLFLGKLADFLNPYLLCFLYFCLIFGLIWRSSHKKEYIIFFLYLHLVFLIAAFYKFKTAPERIIPAGGGTRYFYIPYIMIVWSLFVKLEEIRDHGKRLISVALILILFSSLSYHFRSHSINYNWKIYSKKIGKLNISVPINPKGWQINIGTRK